MRPRFCFGYFRRSWEGVRAGCVTDPDHQTGDPDPRRQRAGEEGERFVKRGRVRSDSVDCKETESYCRTFTHSLIIRKRQNLKTTFTPTASAFGMALLPRGW